MKHNWKFIITPSGNISFALCVGEELYREFNDVNNASIIEPNYDIEGPTVDDFMKDEKRVIDTWNIERKRITHKIIRTKSSAFRALQKRIEKAKENK